MTIDIENRQVKKSLKRRSKTCLQKTCSVKMLKKRLPILEWLPKYKAEYIVQDCIAGITVALTAVPQGIAFAVLTGLSPEYGLYASLTSGIVYVFFGSCYNVTVGPTAILAAMTAKYVTDYSPDFAIFASFLAGVFILLLGVFNLGFLVEFISMPVISGFMNAAALQIVASQLKSFFGMSGSSGSNFGESMYNFFTNIKTLKLWDSVLGVSTVIMLILLKKLGEGCSRTDGIIKKTRWFISISRNAVVVAIGMIIAYIISVTTDTEPLNLTGDIGKGLPKFGLPPFSTVVGNETLNFIEMVQVLGVQSIVIPFVAILETIAIAKAFAEGGRIDATQEMIAVGLCNIVGSFGQSMPITGSFSRTALNHVSGVKTPAGGVTKVIILILALTYMTSAFYYIPKATLAALIITALFYMMDYQIFVNLWKTSKKELMLLIKTMTWCLFLGLEYGILLAVLLQALVLLYTVARPTVKIEVLKHDKEDLLVIYLSDNVPYCAAEHVRRKILRATANNTNFSVILNGANLRKFDYTAASNLVSIIQDLDKIHHIVFLNFDSDVKKMLLYIDSRFETKFVYASDPIEVTGVLPKDV